MHIKNSDHLRQWLIAELTPISEADPVPLARYVNALLKKDMETEKLREFCVDQLDVFLGEETRNFVDRLFDVVSTDKYMPAGEEKEQQTDEKVKEPRSSRKEKRLSKRVKDDEEVRSPKSSRNEKKTSESSRHEDKKLRTSLSRTESSVDNISTRESDTKRLKDDDETKSSKSLRHESGLLKSSHHDGGQMKSTYSEERSPKKSYRHEEESLKKHEEKKSSVFSPGVGNADSVMHPFDDKTKKRKSNEEMKASTLPQCAEDATKSAKVHIKRPRITPPDFGASIGKTTVRESTQSISTDNSPTMKAQLSQSTPIGTRTTPALVKTTPRARIVPPNVDSSTGVASRTYGGYCGTTNAPTLQMFAQPTHSVIPAPQDVKPLIPIPQFSQCVSDTLILTHIPKEKLTMATLEEFFSRYGSVRSVTLRYNNRDDCALVSFVDAATTEVAMKSSQAILDNRFIRMSVFDPNRVSHAPAAKAMSKQERRVVMADNQTTENTTSERDEEVRQLKERMRQLQDEINRAKAKEVHRSKLPVPRDRGNVSRGLPSLRIVKNESGRNVMPPRTP